MAIWKARITAKTNLDMNGRQDVAFIIIRPNGQVVVIDGQQIMLRASGSPTTIRGNVTQEATRFINELIEELRLKIGDEIDFEI